MASPIRPVHVGRAGAVLAALLVVPLAFPSLAAATPVEEKRAQAARLERQLQEQGRQVSVLAERYNQARLALGRVEANLARTRAGLSQAEQRIAGVRGQLSRIAVTTYVQGGSTSLLASMMRAGPPGATTGDLVVRRQYLRLAVADHHRLLGELRSAREDMASRRARLEADQRSARSAASAADAARRQAADAAARERSLLTGVRGDLARLVAEQEARREAAAHRPGPSATAPSPRPLPLPIVGLLPRPSAGRGAVAVAEALKHVGKPYRWGGSGPDNFDCSGLTSYAWRAAGVRLSHSAYTQYNETTRVPVDQIQPGDLLFFGPSVSGIHHNAMYIGNGQMVEASRTGTPIRVRGWRSGDLVGVGRPR